MSIRRFIAYYTSLSVCCVILFPHIAPAGMASIPTRVADVPEAVLVRAYHAVHAPHSTVRKTRYFHRNCGISKSVGLFLP